jgi:hypothetical protein
VLPIVGTTVYTAHTSDIPVERTCGEYGQGRVTSMYYTSTLERSGDPILSDISLCDLVWGGLDIVYIPTSQQVYLAVNTIGTPYAVLIGLTSVLVAGLLSVNMEYILHSQVEPGGWYLTMSGGLVLIASVVASSPGGNVLHPYITTGDKLGLLTLLVYELYCAGKFLYLTRVGTPVHPVNAFVALLLIAAMRVHMTLDNIYTSFALFLLAARLANKLSFSRPTTTERVDAVVDAMLLSVIAWVGIVPQYHGDVTQLVGAVTKGCAATLFLNRVRGSGGQTCQNDDHICYGGKICQNVSHRSVLAEIAKTILSKIFWQFLPPPSPQEPYGSWGSDPRTTKT